MDIGTYAWAQAPIPASMPTIVPTTAHDNESRNEEEADPPVVAAATVVVVVTVVGATCPTEETATCKGHVHTNITINNSNYFVQRILGYARNSKQGGRRWWHEFNLSVSQIGILCYLGPSGTLKGPNATPVVPQ